MTIPTVQGLYAQTTGLATNEMSIPVFATRAPATTDTKYPEGKRWINTSSGTEYSLGSFSVSNGVVSASWITLGTGSTGSINGLITDDLTTVAPSSGNVTLAGTSNQIATSGSGATATLTLSSTLVAPGTVGVTGLLTANASATIKSAGTALNLGSDNSGDAVNLAVGTVARAVGIANSAAAHIVTIGSTTGAAAVTIQSGSGNITLTGNAIIGTTGKQLRCKGGAATDFIGQTTLVTGTKTIANTNIATGDRVFLTRSSTNSSTALGELVVTIVASTSFTITSVLASDAATTVTGDTSIVDYFIVRSV